METSPFAYAHILMTLRRNPSPAGAMGTAGSAADNSATDLVISHKLSVYGPLLWLYRFFMRLAVGGAPADSMSGETPDNSIEAFASRYSRGTRRMIERDGLFRDLQKLKIQLYIERLLFGGLSPAQAQEKRARISGRGRIAVYGLRSWGTRLQRRARLTCYDHGWWRMPQSSAVNDGMWEVQLAPN